MIDCPKDNLPEDQPYDGPDEQGLEEVHEPVPQGWPPIFARMRTGAGPWGLNISCPFSGLIPFKSRDWKVPLEEGGRGLDFPRGGVDDFII